MYVQQFEGGIIAEFGRANVMELWGGFFPDWRLGRDGFMNTSLGLPLVVNPSTPLITNAAGIIKAGERGPEAAFLVFESQNVPTTVGLDFPNGVELVGLLRREFDVNRPNHAGMVNPAGKELAASCLLRQFVACLSFFGWAYLANNHECFNYLVRSAVSIDYFTSSISPGRQVWSKHVGSFSVFSIPPQL